MWARNARARQKACRSASNCGHHIQHPGRSNTPHLAGDGAGSGAEHRGALHRGALVQLQGRAGRGHLAVQADRDAAGGGSERRHFQATLQLQSTVTGAARPVMLRLGCSTGPANSESTTRYPCPETCFSSLKLCDQLSYTLCTMWFYIAEHAYSRCISTNTAEWRCAAPGRTHPACWCLRFCHSC